jgi:WD40 repeat protein
MRARIGVLLLPLLIAGTAGGADEPLVPPADGKPVLQLDGGGPMAAVTALAFAPDGKTLYVGGYDKIVRAWVRDEKSGKFKAQGAYHIPIGPGLNGLINALAVSPDGKQLAVAGSGAVRGTAGFGDTGLIVPLPGRLTPAMEKDWGAIYLFDLEKENDAVRPLRAHRGPVLRLTFLPAWKDKPPLLVSVGREGTDKVAVRLWDTAKGELLAERDDLPDPGGNEPPGLAAWHTGPERLDVGVATALATDLSRPDRKEAPPGRLLYWNVNKDDLKSWKLDGKFFTNTAAFRPGASFDGVLYTADARPKAGSRPAGACLQAWPVTDKGPQLDADRIASIGNGAVPKTLTLLSKQGDRAPDLAAAVLVFPPDKEDPKSPMFRLVLMGRTADADYGDMKASVKLWSGAGRPPVAAASPDGTLLALAGGPDHSVWVYSVADLLNNKTDPIQKIISTGALVREVAFVRNKGKNPGLLLRQNQLNGGDWVLDIDGHKLQNGRDGWDDDSPALGGWKVAGAGDGLSFTVQQNGKEIGVVHLGAGRPKTIKPQPTCRPALLPPVKPRDRALLAVAYLEQGVSYLELFDVVADRPVRRLTGHVDAVRNLTFSADGRYLASAADDQTVAFWSLTDLDKVVQKGGTLPGFAVEQKGAKVAVSTLNRDALSAGNRKALKDVKVGDAVDGVVSGKTLKSVKSPQDVYDAVWDVKPGDSIILRIGEADVSATVDQGEDERKPLFSFFMRDEAKDRLWLAWNPTGPYDAVDRVRAESVIGWHSNTGKPAAPASFSPAAQYRKETYRPGLLKYLVEEGNLSDALKKWNDAAPPKPGMGLRLEAPKTQFPRDAQGRVLVQGPPLGLTLHGELFDILASKVKRVRWRFDDGDWRDFDWQTDVAFTAELDKANLTWRGRPHEFSLLVETLEAVPTQYTRRLPVSFAPPRPAITSAQPDSQEVNAKAFPFTATAAVGKDGPDAAKIRVTLRVNNGEPKVVGAKISETLDLAEGDNFIEALAVNDDAPPETAAAETATRRWKVRYTAPKKVAAPTIYFESISSASDKPRDDKPLVVHSRTVRVRGRITSAEPLVEAAYDGHALTGFAASGADKLDFPIDESITLKNVGEQTALKFTARCGKGDPTTKSLLLKYEPPAPRFEFEKDAPELIVAGDQEKVPVRGRVIKTEDDPSDYKVEARLNGQAVNGVELKEDSLIASLSPRPGDNTIEVILSNKFDRHVEAIHCYRRRLPVVTKLSHADVGANPLVELTALVESPADRPLSGVRIASDAVADLAPNYTLVKQAPLAEGANLQTWKVVVASVLLKEGKGNRLKLWARNEDGESQNFQETAIAFAPPKPAIPPPPTLTVLEPRLNEEVVETPEGRLAFRVQWNGPAGNVVVLINNKVRNDAGLVTSPAAPDGTVTYQTDALPLESGPNIVQVSAVNEGGRRLSESYTLFYRQRSAVIRLTGLSAVKRSAPPDGPLGHGGQLKFPKQDASDVWVHGQVEWPDETDPVLAQNQPAHVRVWVNDFEQFEASLAPRRGRVREFTAELRLNNTANRIEVGSSEVKAERVAFNVACSQPARTQRLHLLLVAPGRRDEAKVTEEMLTAFQAHHVEGDRFDTAAFGQGRLYGPVIKLAQREEVFDALENMKSAIYGAADGLNDVIVVFFHGEQLVTEDEHFLLTGETKRLLPNLKPGEKLDSSRLDRLKETALTCDKFRELLADMHGAKLVLLDARDPIGGKGTKERVTDLLEKAGGKFPKIGCLDYVLLGANDPAAGDFVGLLHKSLERPSSLKDLTGMEDDLSQGPNRLFRCFVPDGLLSINLGSGGS